MFRPLFLCLVAGTAAAQTPGAQGAKAMKNLVVYYSLTEKTHVVAQTLAGARNGVFRQRRPP
jgi:hypothetical protein